ncbi:hypothetical protein BD311DRAFT_88714 [Dichomitus squalens]|uniref:Carbohydrate kinase FGGY N-terminal domain-containing protein n=1 Tax=Dichomitus squalens TaxID=114155 RepID=A0A4Q9M8E9_9APHY|nr:hypothetical protein BD311DRAFT_88714 [Dichomitus squalens]
MPPKSLSTFFLGLELATDQLRASIVDENLELVGVEIVDFDTEISEYQVTPWLSRVLCPAHRPAFRCPSRRDYGLRSLHSLSAHPEALLQAVPRYMKHSESPRRRQLRFLINSRTL